MDSINIKVENTAISNGVSSSCKILKDTIINRRDLVSVLDYGCGRLRNTRYLSDICCNISVIDTKAQIEKQEGLIRELGIDNTYTTETIKECKETFDYILCSYVLNVIPDIEVRKEVVDNISSLLKEEGRAYIEVRRGNFLNSVKYKEVYKDGYIVGKDSKKTFQKSYTVEEFISFLKESSLRVLGVYLKSESVVAVVRKTQPKDLTLEDC